MESIALSHHSGVLTLTLQRPEKRNALNNAMYRYLADVIDAAALDTTVRVMMLTGSEQVFCAGNDLQDFQDSPPVTPDAPAWRFLRSISTFPKPLVAVVCGPAVGIGTTLLLHCDIVLAAENASFTLPFVDLGVCPEAASSLLLPRLIGLRRAAEFIMGGAAVNAHTALVWGLINQVCKVSDALTLAHQYAEHLALKPSSVLIAAKHLLKSDAHLTVAARIDQEGALFGQMICEAPAREAIRASIEKRRPDFSQY